MATEQEVQAILDEHCTRQYFIEYRRYLSNHLAHGVIALYRLGASKSRILEFVQWYTPRLEPSSKFGFEQEEDSQPLSDDEFGKLLGKRQQFYSLLKKYHVLLQDTYKNDLEAFIRGEFPKMADGLHCAAFHPLIHLGYGFDVRNTTLVVEGMAYLHFSHMETKAIPWNTSERNVEILDVLNNLKESKAVRGKTKTYAASPEWMPDISGSFQREVGVLTSHPWVRGNLQIMVESIKLPEWFDLSNANMEAMIRLMDTVLHWAILVYACAEKRNDFFLLHGVTGAWSLLQLLQTFTDPAKAFDCIQYYLAALLAAYVAQECPAIDLKFLESPPNASLDELRDEALTMTTDEHVYKLIHVCRELGKKNLDEDKQTLYKVACRAVMDFKFPF